MTDAFSKDRLYAENQDLRERIEELKSRLDSKVERIEELTLRRDLQKQDYEERIAELKAHNLGLTKTLVEFEAELKKLRNGMPVYFDKNALEQGDE